MGESVSAESHTQLLNSHLRPLWEESPFTYKKNHKVRLLETREHSCEIVTHKKRKRVRFVKKLDKGSILELLQLEFVRWLQILKPFLEPKG